MKKFQRKVIFIRIFTRLVFILTFIPHSYELDSDSYVRFCYEDTECEAEKKYPWPELCLTGRHQSPINLPTVNSHAQAMVLNVDWSSYEWKKFLISNNGHTIVLRMTEHTTKSKSFLKDHNNYAFSRAHFHWGENNNVGSEHTVGGKQFALEMHLVHYSNHYSSLEEAAKNVTDRMALSVIGILFDAADDHPNSVVMKTINDVIPQNMQDDPRTVQFDLRDVLPKRGATFYRYAGSLTTPPCSEIVQWVVFTQPIKISTLDMKYFRKVTDFHGYHLKRNFRPVQPGNLRLLEFMKIE